VYRAIYYSSKRWTHRGTCHSVLKSDVWVFLPVTSHKSWSLMKSYCPASGNETIIFSIPMAVTALVRCCEIYCGRNCSSGVNTKWTCQECKANIPVERVATAELLNKIPVISRAQGFEAVCLKLLTTWIHLKPQGISSHTPTITVYDNTSNITGTSTSMFCNKPLYIIILLLGPAKVWRVCRKWQRERVLGQCCPSSSIYFAPPASLYCEQCV
jgi:hypothetical protein